MPVPDAPSPHFKVVQKIEVDYAPVHITQYESTRTGMRTVVVDQKGPKVNGYFALATEIHDDSGAPHTLEHLCFMGSRTYKYKGLLDRLSTRAYSTTNAWTATDHTAYTLETAGWEGFAQILPVYLEHLIVPTLTDSACYTEVHHIDGTGHDAGVVYSEMQGCQNNQLELIDLHLRRLMYQEGNGFRYETGGMMEQLRKLTADRIREFHKDMYQPKNMCLVITGEVDHVELLQILSSFEETILDDVPSLDAPFKRPWVESKSTPALTHTTVDTVKFPEEDESTGLILTYFFGPSCNDVVATAALEILMTYLTGSSIAILENTLVEKEQLCSMAYSYTETRLDMVVVFGLCAVETEKLAAVEKRLFEVLHETAHNPLDMDYMRECIHRSRRQTKLASENAGEFFNVPIIEDHLFGNRNGADLKELESLRDLDQIEKWTDEDWRSFLLKWFVNAPHVSALGVPSQELAEKITQDETARVQAQKQKLGDDGLKELAQRLKEAQDANNIPIPDPVLEKFPLPNAKSIHFIPTVTARAGTARKMGKLDNHIQALVDRDDHNSPLFIHFEHIQSSFVRINLHLCTSSVPVELKPLLILYISNFFTTPVWRNGKRVEFEDVVLELEKESVAYDCDSGRGNEEMLYIALTIEPEKYDVIIQWLKTLLFDAIHDPTRLYASCTKVLADIPDLKRDGGSMIYAVDTMTKFRPASSKRAMNTLSRALYLKRLRKMMKKDKSVVVEKFTEMVKHLHRPENFRIYVAADVVQLPKPVSSWDSLISGLDTSKPLEPLATAKALLNDTGKDPGSTAYIVPMATSDSSWALLTAKGPDSYTHPDLPALMLAISYMDVQEGPLWVGVRGEGLAYGTGFSRSTGAGQLSYRISKSPDAYKAYVSSKEQVDAHATGRQAIDRFTFEGAISDVVLRVADEQPTMASAAEVSYISQVLLGVSKDHSHQLLAQVQKVTVEEVREAMAKYLVPVFDPTQANLVVTCAKIMEENLVANFAKAGFQPEVRPLAWFQDDYGLTASEGDDETDERDDEDEDDDDDDDDDDDEDDDGGSVSGDEDMETPESDES